MGEACYIHLIRNVVNIVSIRTQATRFTPEGIYVLLKAQLTPRYKEIPYLASLHW